MNSGFKKHLVVGLGSIGMRHSALLLKRGFAVAGVDPYVRENPGVACFENLESGFEFGPDMVWICSPTELHAEQACQVIERGVHLFIEKPLAHDLASARKILNSFEGRKDRKLVWVGCNMRFHPAVTKLHELLEKNCIGSPLIFRIHFSHWLPNMRPGKDYRETYAAGKDGGGVLLDDIHDIDLALWFSGSAAEISGMKARSGLLEMKEEDIANITIVHENGVFSNIHMDFIRKNKSRGIQVTGETGTLEWTSFGKNPERAEIRLFRGNENQVEIVWKENIFDFDAMFESQLDAVTRLVNQPEKYHYGLNQAVDALKVVSAVKKNSMYE